MGKQRIQSTTITTEQQVQKWMNDLGDTTDSLYPIGVEIVGRIIIRSDADFDAMDDLLEAIRGLGAARVSQRVVFGGNNGEETINSDKRKTDS